MFHHICCVIYNPNILEDSGSMPESTRSPNSSQTTQPFNWHRLRVAASPHTAELLARPWLVRTARTASLLELTTIQSGIVQQRSPPYGGIAPAAFLHDHGSSVRPGSLHTLSNQRYSGLASVFQPASPPAAASPLRHSCTTMARP